MTLAPAAVRAKELDVERHEERDERAAEEAVDHAVCQGRRCTRE
jgi:hypothetical protein